MKDTERAVRTCQSTDIVAPRKEIRGLKNLLPEWLYRTSHVFLKRNLPVSSHFWLRIVFIPTDLVS